MFLDNIFGQRLVYRKMSLEKKKETKKGKTIVNLIHPLLFSELKINITVKPLDFSLSYENKIKSLIRFSI